MTTFLIIATIIAILFLLSRFLNRKTDNVLSAPMVASNVNTTNKLMESAWKKFHKEDYSAAIAIADNILRLEPDNYKALTIRASSLEVFNFNLEAIEDYERALSINNSDANINGLLGLTYYKIGDIDNTQKYLQVSIQKGLKLYESHYDTIQTLPEETKQMIIRKGQLPENLKRRS
jgi:tetratricopeptide (TPR) repeat protein